MKREKQGYVLYRSWTPVLLAMSDEDLAKIFRAILKYQEGQPVTDTPPFFQSIQATFEQDQEKYNRRCEDNRLNRMIGNLKGLREDVLQAQIEMMSVEDLQAIVEKAKDTDLKNAVILELHRRTQVTRVTHDRDETHVTDVTDKESGEEKESGKGLEMGTREEPHFHGDYQNIVLTDSEWSDLAKQFGMDTVDKAINNLSYTLRHNRDTRQTGDYEMLSAYLQNENA